MIHGDKKVLFLGIADDLTELSVLHATEPTSEILTAMKQVGFPKELTLQLQNPMALHGAKILQESLLALPTPLDGEPLETLLVDYANIYLTHSIGASPYESVWIDDDHLILQEPMFQIMSFYKAFGLQADNWRERSEDHIALQLQFLSYLLDEPNLFCLTAAAQFLDEHLLRWISGFSTRVAECAQTNFFAGLALLTGGYLEELRTLLEQVLHIGRPSKEEIDMRMKPERLVQIGTASYLPQSEPTW